MMNYRAAAEYLHPNVEFRWAGDNNEQSLADCGNIRDWDRNKTGIPKPTRAELEAKWAEIVAAEQAQAGQDALDKANQDAALAGIRDRYTAFEGQTFLEIVAQIDQWAANTNAALDGATALAQVRPVVQGAFLDIAEFLGPLLAYAYITRQHGE